MNKGKSSIYMDEKMDLWIYRDKQKGGRIYFLYFKLDDEFGKYLK